MSFKKTRFNFFYNECIKKFGEQQGEKIYDMADKKLRDMQKEADYPNNKSIKKHMDLNMLPIIAIYLSFNELDFDQEEAYNNTMEISQSMARKIKRKNHALSRLPFGYSLFKVFCKSIMNKEYPKEGWDVEWQKYDNKEIHFDITRCVYMETTERYGCPELCSVFCENDTTTFSGYEPKIIFERQGTIGQGQKLCDFHFKNGNFYNAKV